MIGLVLDSDIFTRGKKVGNPEVLIMDFDGDKVWSKSFQDEFDEFTEAQIRRYTLRLSDSGEDVTVRLGKRLMRFKIAE